MVNPLRLKHAEGMSLHVVVCRILIHPHAAPSIAPLACSPHVLLLNQYCPADVLGVEYVIFKIHLL